MQRGMFLNSDQGAEHIGVQLTDSDTSAMLSISHPTADIRSHNQELPFISRLLLLYCLQLAWPMHLLATVVTYCEWQLARTEIKVIKRHSSLHITAIVQGAQCSNQRLTVRSPDCA